MKILALALSSLLAATMAVAQPYPTAPIKLITPFAAGSGADIVARLIAQGMSTELGQSVVIENRVGAGGNIGLAAGAKAAPDGYTLVLGTSGPLTVNPTLYSSVPFDPDKDFAPISVVAVGPMVVAVGANSRFKSLAEMMSAAKAAPQSINYGTPGVGSAPHMAAALLQSASSTEMTHIPYKGNGEALSELMGGRIEAVFSGIPPVVALAKAGKIRLLAVTGATRSAMLPDVPSIVEAGFPNAQLLVWYGILAPAKTPQPIVDKLHAAIGKALERPAIKERFTDLGLAPDANTPDQFSKLIREDGKELGSVIRRMGMKAE